MPAELTEAFIKGRLQKAYHPEMKATTDGYVEVQDGMPLKCAAVLLALVWWKEEWQLVFTRRTETVEYHKGQVSFPGGGCEVHETTPEETALREAEEEIGLRRGDIRILGRMNDVATVTGFRIMPVIGVMKWPFEYKLEPAEVVRVFVIPITWLADRNNWDERPFTVDGLPRSFPVIIYHPYDGEILWGASARITQNFLNVLGFL